MYPLQQPEFYLSNAADKLSDTGEVPDDETKKIVGKLLKKFIVLVAQLRK